MSGRAYDFAVFIGRFQPFHNGHLTVIKQALEAADKVLILVGSADSGCTMRNPFSYEERAAMIRQGAITGELINRIVVHPLPDRTYDDRAWVNQVLHLVDWETSHSVSPRICLIGNERDHSSYYLRLFPGWDYIPVTDDGVNATEIRAAFFAGGNVHDFISPLVPASTMDALQRWRDKPDYGRLMAARKFYQDYRAQWGKGPFVTVDSVVLHGNKVLLIERSDGHDAGLLALPGGFLELDETLLSGARRELREETELQFLAAPGPLAVKTYDDPHRSPRGRIITTAFLFDISAGSPTPPPVVGADDAKSAAWHDISSLQMERMFEDHGHIIRDMLRQRNAR